MYNPYKAAGDILSETSESDNDFSSVDLYGSAVQKKNENSICSAFHLENESGVGAKYLLTPTSCIWNTVIKHRIPDRGVLR